MAKSQVSTIDDTPADTVAPDTTNTVLGAGHDSNMSGKYEVITIHSSAEDNGAEAVFVSHNTYPFQIPRDTPCKVPTEVAQILRDAKVTSYRSAKNGEVVEETRPRYAFSAQPA